MRKLIDAHIHLDLYSEEERTQILRGMKEAEIEGLITVSMHLASSQMNQQLAQHFQGVYPCYGYHPEQALPRDEDLADLFQWIRANAQEMVAVGEVGLPYYLRQEQHLDETPYIELLDQFIQLAKHLHKPIVLHAVYDDAPKVCQLLEKYSYNQAHFHWFKGDPRTIERMARNGYFVSHTPDLLYEAEIVQLVQQYPLGQMMVETDGPWPFTGPFQGMLTEPKMMHHTVNEIARIKGLPIATVYEQLESNTRRFYSLDLSK